MNWNQDKSLKLSKICIGIFTVAVAVGCVLVPWFIPRYIEVRVPQLAGKDSYFYTTIYTLVIPVSIALYKMQILLKNISREEVFVPENVQIMRVLSWCCLAAGVIFGISTLYYLLYLLLSVMAFFMGLILRVVKNVFAQAVEIREENDYTI